MHPRPFELIDRDALHLRFIHATTPRLAALRVATRRVTQILLLDTERERLHVYEGWCEDLDPSARTKYERDRGVSSRSNVRKLCSVPLVHKPRGSHPTGHGELDCILGSLFPSRAVARPKDNIARMQTHADCRLGENSNPSRDVVGDSCPNAAGLAPERGDAR